MPVSKQADIVAEKIVTEDDHRGELQRDAKGVLDLIGPFYTEEQRTSALVRGLVVILEHHRASILVQEELGRQVHRYLDETSSEEVWMKRAKYLLNYPLARYLGNESPKKPDQVFEPSGRLRTWMSNRIRVFKPTNTHLWYSWLQAKRCALPVSSEFVTAAFDDHFKLLTAEDPGDDEKITQIMSNPVFARLLKKVRKNVARRYDPNDFMSSFPSENASFEVTRSQGGQKKALRIDAGLIRLDSKGYTHTSLNLPELILVRMVWTPLCHRKGRSDVLSIYEPYGREEWENLYYRPSSVLRFVEHVDHLKAGIQAVREPMKVRTISKGEAIHYYRMKPLQKALHGVLRNIPCFRLIGRPFEVDMLEDLRKLAHPSHEWFSIDYSSATDNLSWKYSGAILRSVLEGLPDAVVREALAVLGPHSLTYPGHVPKWAREELELVAAGKSLNFPAFEEYLQPQRDRGVMKRGQLMGSILSFPILCLANLGVYLDVVSQHLPFSTDKDILDHVLVNGDDMLYSAPPVLWEKHVEVGRKVGLEMSVGKAYRHPEYCNINSVSCLSDLRRESPVPRRIDFLNVGLLFGQHKVQKGPQDADSHHDGPTTKAQCFNEVMKGCFRFNKEVARKYLRIHKDDLVKESECLVQTKGIGGDGRVVRERRQMLRNYFLPESIGGLGMLPVDGLRYQVTFDQKKLACCLARDYERKGVLVDSQRPLRGYEPVSPLEVPATPWTMCGSHKEGGVFHVQGISRREVGRVYSRFRSGIILSVKHPAHVLSLPTRDYVEVSHRRGSRNRRDLAEIEMEADLKQLDEKGIWSLNPKLSTESPNFDKLGSILYCARYLRRYSPWSLKT